MAEIARSIAIRLDQALPANAEEATLIAELQAGSEEAFAYLMAVYRNPVYNMVYHIMGGESDAGDVLQNVFVKIIRGIKQFRKGSSLKTWIYRIAVHEALNYRRSWFRLHRREVLSLDDEQHGQPAAGSPGAAPQGNPYELVEQQERQELVSKALRSLAEPYRTVVVLRELESLSYDEIGQVLGVAEGTVKSRLKRGRELLRRKLLGCSAMWNY
jgi:RNA polymerase sigma-70 factor (ECF subfamily)